MAGSSRTIEIWDVVRNETVFAPRLILRGPHKFTAVAYSHDGRHVAALACSPNGRLAATGGVDKMVCIWDVQNRRRSASLGPFEDEVTCLIPIARITHVDHIIPRRDR